MPLTVKAEILTNNSHFRYLTNEGIEYLRQYLHLPSEIVPSTLKRTARSETARPRAAPRSDGPKSGEDRQAYRRAPGQGQDKKADVGAGAGDLELVSLEWEMFADEVIFRYILAWWIWSRISSTISCCC